MTTINKKTITVYKVVREFRRKLYSVGFGTSEQSCVQYKMRQWAKPVWDGSYLMAFNSLENAEEWKLNSRDYRIYEAVTPSTVEPARYLADPFDENVEWYWKRIAKGELTLDEETGMYTPEGTVWCPEIKLIKRIV